MNEEAIIVDENEQKSRHLLKTARRANESKNYKREVELLKQPTVLMPEVTPHLLRRYASALYKRRENRAAALNIFDEKCVGDNDESFVFRLWPALENEELSRIWTSWNGIGFRW